MSFPKIEGYIVTEKLGSGSYSTVYKAYTKVGARSIVAIKCVDKSQLKQSGSAVDNLITEIRLLKTLTHPHIVQMKHFDWDDKNIYIVMEFCSGGDLSKYIHKYGRVPEQQVLYFLQQLASALKFLREKGVVHMDLKPHNLLLHKSSDAKYILKVGDFGFAQYLSVETARAIRGSPLYMAPEMIVSTHYDARVDLWSVGVIMYECLFGRAPYSSATFKELVEKIERKAPIEIPRNSSVSAGCTDLLTRLLQHDPEKRISYEEFFKHEYLDLDHMPSKENYEKAVSLIKHAVECDSAGKLQEAFCLYRDSLQYLVPCVSCETDSVRRSALRAKLTRYMERAEEIKTYLKCSNSTEEPVPNLPVNNSTHTVQPRLTACHPFACASPQTNSTTSVVQCNEEILTDDEDETPEANTEAKPIEEHKPASVPKTRPERSPSRFAFRRLFSRYTVPLLENKDSSIIEDPLQTKQQKAPVGEATDACKIS